MIQNADPEENWPLVFYHCIRIFRKTGRPLDSIEATDEFSIAAVAYMECVRDERFDSRKGRNFATYAGRKIEQAIYNHWRSNGSPEVALDEDFDHTDRSADVAERHAMIQEVLDLMETELSANERSRLLLALQHGEAKAGSLLGVSGPVVHRCAARGVRKLRERLGLITRDTKED